MFLRYAASERYALILDWPRALPEDEHGLVYFTARTCTNTLPRRGGIRMGSAVFNYGRNESAQLSLSMPFFGRPLPH